MARPLGPRALGCVWLLALVWWGVVVCVCVCVCGGWFRGWLLYCTPYSLSFSQVQFLLPGTWRPAVVLGSRGGPFDSLGFFLCRFEVGRWRPGRDDARLAPFGQCGGHCSPSIGMGLLCSSGCLSAIVMEKWVVQFRFFYRPRLSILLSY